MNQTHHGALRRWAAGGFAALAFLAVAPAAHAINNGVQTTSFAAVGWGVQVAPNWVLTAYHAAIGVGGVYSNGYGSFNVLARYDAPGAGSPAFPANDLTLLRIGGNSGAPYIPIYDTFMPTGNFGPWNATIVSGGASSASRTYGWTTVSESQVLVDPDDDGPLGPVTANFLVSHDTQVYVQDGDSAGALFYGHVTNSSVLLGITSAQYTDANNVPNGSGFVQLAAYRSWIDSVLANDTADTQVLNWVSAVPEPATWLLWALGAAAVVGRTRRRRSA